MVQVREKKASTRDFIEQASRIKSVTHRHGVPLIINDRLDVALAVGADGIHVGQDDMAATTARALLKQSSSPARKMLLGVTATNEAQARAAELAGADYLGTSAVFPTDTKKDGGAGYVIGLDAVQRICRATSLPVVAVGGINATNAHQIVAHGAAGVGVVSAIVGADCPRTAAAGLAAVVDSALPKYSQELAAKAAEAFERVRERRPLVQNVTNYVVMNDTANATLQAGGSPVMAHENGEMTEHAQAVVLNMGTLDDHWLRQMKAIGQVANAIGVPIVFDPVGAGATHYRTGAALQLLDELRVSVLRGNPGELAALHVALCSIERSLASELLVRGVDSPGYLPDSESIIRSLARTKRTIVAMTGKQDLVSDGERLLQVHNNHILLGQLTGTGCMVTSLIGAFVGALPTTEQTHAVAERRQHVLEATAAALAYFCHAAERAGARTIAEGLGPGSFHTALLDELFLLTPHELEQHARIVDMRHAS